MQYCTSRDRFDLIQVVLDVVGGAGVDVESAGADVELQTETVEERGAHGHVDGEQVVGVVAEDAHRGPLIPLQDVVHESVQVLLDVRGHAGHGRVAFLVGDRGIAGNTKRQKRAFIKQRWHKHLIKKTVNKI